MTARLCENCGTALVGEYCHACGQRALEPDELTLRHALHVSAADVGHLESKTLRSMLLLFRPGFLTAEYLAGRRAPYTSPLKLYLACAAIFFLLAPFVGFTLEQLMAGSPDLRTIVERELAGRAMDPALFFERFDLRFQTVYTVSLAASVMASALMLALLFRRQRRPVGAHVIYALHYVSFLYVITIAISWLTGKLPPHPLMGVLVVLIVLGAYQFVALRRVYGEPLRSILWKLAVMLLFALFFDSLVNILAVIVTMKLV